MNSTDRNKIMAEIDAGNSVTLLIPTCGNSGKTYESTVSRYKLLSPTDLVASTDWGCSAPCGDISYYIDRDQRIKLKMNIKGSD